MALLQGKKALVLGVANEKSIAWGIAKALKGAGAALALSYLNEALKRRVEPLAGEIGADFTFELDVTRDAQLEALPGLVRQHWQGVDVIIHSLAYADRDDLKGRFSDTSREGFKLACDVSAFSLIGVCQHLRAVLNAGASVVAMTYHGSTQVVAGYKVMGVAKAALEASARYLADDLGLQGVRVNCISAGPVRTLAASGVPGMRQIFGRVEENSPLRRNVTTADIGGAATFLCSDAAAGVTGQVLYVDSGFSIKQI